MSHYFDDIFGRLAQGGPAKPAKALPYRRSSSSRSIGVRSDFEPSVSGDDALDDAVFSPGSAVAGDAAEGREERQEAHRHMANYVNDQLARARRSSFRLGIREEEEFETQLDEK